MRRVGSSIVRSTAALLALVVGHAAAPSAVAETRSSRTFEETFVPTSGAFETLVVDNVLGSIEVRAHARDTVEMKVSETVIARTEGAAERARSEVRLETKTSDGVVELFVNGPFRDSDDDRRWRQERDPGYRVIYDFALSVPAGIAVDLRTVTEGDIEVAGVRGAFRLRNVNGALRLLDASGSGSLHTVNGGIEASFLEPPRAALDVETLNGDIELAFPRALAAELHFKSFNGELRVAAPERGGWELVGIPTQVRIEDRADGARYRIDKWSSWRIGAGGPPLRVETLNGNVILTANPRDPNTRDLPGASR